MDATYLSPDAETQASDGPDPRVLAAIRELKRHERTQWPAVRARIRALGHPTNEADDDDDDEDDDEDDEDEGKKAAKKPAAKRKPAASDDDDDDDDDDADDDDDDELAKAKREAAEAKARAARAERALKKQQRADARKKNKDAADKGEFEELYKSEKDRADNLEKRLRQGAFERSVLAAAGTAKAKKPERIVKLLDLDYEEIVDEDGEVDEAAITKAVRDLKKSDGYLFKADDSQAADVAGDRNARSRRGRRRPEDDDVRGAGRIRRAYGDN